MSEDDAFQHALKLIADQLGTTLPPGEIAARAEVEDAMEDVKNDDPDPYPEDLHAALLAGDDQTADWLAHTPAGKRLARQRRKWMRRMREQHVQVRARVLRSQLRLLPVNHRPKPRPVQARGRRRGRVRSGSARSPSTARAPDPLGRPRPSELADAPSLRVAA